MDELKKEDYEEQSCLLCMTDSGYKVPIKRIIEKFDSLLSYNKAKEAERHMLYWLEESTNVNDKRSVMSICNELMGFYRINGNEEKAIYYANKTFELCNELEIENTSTRGTTVLNVATVYKAFNQSQKALVYYREAQKIYQEVLDPYDSKMGGLYNNMGLALVDLKMFDEALDSYNKAIDITFKNNELLDCAISYLNIATLYENKLGLLEAETEIDQNLTKAISLLDNNTVPRNGYYAFVCDKCSTVFDYYGYFLYAKELRERRDAIYARD